MISSLKSELRKLFSVRSTYVVSVLAICIAMLLSWVLVWSMKQNLDVGIGGMTTNIGEQAPEAADGAAGDMREEVATKALGQEWLTTREREVVMNSFSTVAIFVAIVVILQIIHEYRYNTIIYTLTARASRTAALISKVAVLLGYAVLMALVAALASYITCKVAYGYYGLDLPAQTLEWGGAMLRGGLFLIAFASFAAVIAFLSRNIALAIAAFFIFPGPVEELFALLLKQNSVYLPFSAATQLVLYNEQTTGALDFRHALMTTAAYLIVFYALTWYLFIKRDAN